jgi:hypothetical protein
MRLGFLQNLPASSALWVGGGMSLHKQGDRGIAMRDIRSDLEERAHLIQEQLRAAYAHFEKVVQQLQNERDARVAELTETLAMIDKLMQFEAGVMDKVVTLPNPSAAHPTLADRIRAASA